MIVLLLTILSQVKVNEIVGSKIDSIEARKYQLFTDIEGFQSAQFLEKDDSFIVHLQYTMNDTVLDSSVIIDNELFKSLGSYINNFRMIIEDEAFRLSFIKAFKIGWPIIAQSDLERIMKSSTRARIRATACCMTGACALGAYSAALLTRDIRTEIDTAIVPAPCLTANNGPGCIPIPVPVEREYYKFSPSAYVLGASIGSGLGYVWTKQQFKAQHVLSRAITHDIVAFDDQDFPITEKDISAAHRATNAALFATLGLGAGLLGASATALALLQPWADIHPEKQWHEQALIAAVVVISGVELLIITNFLCNQGKKLDRQATIERLRHRHTQK